MKFIYYYHLLIINAVMNNNWYQWHCMNIHDWEYQTALLDKDAKIICHIIWFSSLLILKATPILHHLQ